MNMKNVFLLLLASVVSATAQEPAEVSTLHTEVRLANADVTILNKRTKLPVPDLSRSDFRLFDNGQEQVLTHFDLVKNDDRPLAIVLLLQESGDVYEQNNLQPDDAEVLDDLRPEDRIAIVSYRRNSEDCSVSTQVIQEFTRDISAIRKVLEHLAAPQPKGQSCLSSDRKVRYAQYDALEIARDKAVRLGAEQIARLKGYRGELIAVEQDFALLANEIVKETEEILLRQNLSLNAIVHTSGSLSISKWMLSANNPKRSGRQHATFSFYAEQTGGILLTPPPSQFGQSLHQLIYGIRAQYSLGWKPSITPGFHQLRIELKDSKGVTVRIKRGYFIDRP